MATYMRLQPVLKSLAGLMEAFAVDILQPEEALPTASWGGPAIGGLHGAAVTEMRDAVRALVVSVVEDPAPWAQHEQRISGAQLLASAIKVDQFEGGLVVTRNTGEPWTDAHRSVLNLASGLCASILEFQHVPGQQERLDELVTYVATELMGVSAADLSVSIQRILGELGRFFGVDTCFLRRNDHELGASVLMDEWPRREHVPDPDPLGVVPYDNADPVFAAVRDQREAITVRPGKESRGYQDRIHAGSGVPEVSMATVPLVRDEDTWGVLGFIHFGDRAWSDPEIGALHAIASLLMQLIARVGAEERLHHQAYHDELTGLANRRAVVERLGRELEEDPRAGIGLLYIDTDRLKTMNDFLGHAAGDEFLREIGRRMQDAVRPDDLAARLAGDEFVMVLRNVRSRAAVEAIAWRLLGRINDEVTIGGHAVSRTASMGIAMNGPEPCAADELLRNADVALLEAKSRGGNTIIMFNDELRTRTTERAELELHLRAAIDDSEMRVYFQPEFDLRTGEITAAEALVRWQHPGRGLMAAVDFISVAEEINLAPELGRWVLEETCRQLASWKAHGVDRRPLVRMNVTAGELISADFVPFVARTLDRYGHHPTELCLEITESMVMRDLNQVLRTIRGLRKLGVTLAMDDFGTGYSSLAQLKALPLDIVKIDRSFVHSLASDPGDRAIVAAIVQIAQAFGLRTVAEGVEDQATADALRELGCFHAQGFLLSAPLPPEAMLALLTRTRVPG